MAFYHWHATAGTAGKCTTMGGHAPSCLTAPFTTNNEVSCTRTTAGPNGRPYKCVHDVPPSPGPGGRARRRPAKGVRRAKPPAKRAKPAGRARKAR